MPSSRAGETVARIAGVLFFGTVQLIWWRQPLPLPLRLRHVGLLILSVARPSWALVAAAGLAPLSSSLRELMRANVDSGWIFDQMAVPVVIGALIRWPRADGRSRLAGP